MSFRTRLFLALMLAVLLPLAALAIGVRRELERRIAEDQARRAAGAMGALAGEIRRESAGVSARLAALAAALHSDNAFRLAVVQGQPAGC